MRRYTWALVALLVNLTAWAGGPGDDNGLEAVATVANVGIADETGYWVEVVIPARNLKVGEVLKPHQLNAEQAAAVDDYIRRHPGLTRVNECALRSAFTWMIPLRFVHTPLTESTTHYFTIQQVVEECATQFDRWAVLPEIRVRVRIPRQPFPQLDEPNVRPIGHIVFVLAPPRKDIGAGRRLCAAKVILDDVDVRLAPCEISCRRYTMCEDVRETRAGVTNPGLRTPTSSGSSEGYTLGFGGWFSPEAAAPGTCTPPGGVKPPAGPQPCLPPPGSQVEPGGGQVIAPKPGNLWP